jgi:hypothetical protein
MPLAAADHHDHWPSATLRPQVELGAEAAPRAAEAFARRVPPLPRPHAERAEILHLVDDDAAVGSHGTLTAPLQVLGSPQSGVAVAERSDVTAAGPGEPERDRGNRSGQDVKGEGQGAGY